MIHSRSPTPEEMNKVLLLNKRVQDKKTQEIFENDKISLDEVTDILEISQAGQGITKSETHTISILATMKSIAHTIQSQARWKKFCSDNNTDDNIYTFSSRGDFTQVSHITDRITLPIKEAPKHIVACTHLTRMNNFLEVARFIERRNSELRTERRLRFYLDEFDEYIDKMRDIVEELIIMKCVEKIVIVTATARKVWCERVGWDSLFVLNPRIDDTDESYLMFKDCRHIDTAILDRVEIPLVTSIVATTDRESIKVLTLHRRIMNMNPDILNMGKIIFAPGCITRSSHEEVALLWNHFGCSSFVFNGERTNNGFYGKLYLFDRTVIDVPHLRLCELESSEMKSYIKAENVSNLNASAQLNEVISDFIYRYNLLATPIVITGLLCIGRAQTLVHPVWGTFTDAIFHSAGSPEKAYQLQRQLGHIRNWTTYRGIPRVFSSEIFRNDVKILESRAFNFGRSFGGVKASLNDYVSTGNDGALTSIEKRIKKTGDRKNVISRIIEYPQHFTSINAVNQFLSDKLKTTVRIKKFHTIDGYELSTRLNAIVKKKKESLTAEDRLTTAKFERIAVGQNISASKGQPYMVYPVYHTMESSPEEVRYIVRYLPPNAS